MILPTDFLYHKAKKAPIDIGKAVRPKKRLVQHEHKVIKAVVEYLTMLRSHPLFFHVPNEGKRSLHQQRTAKQSGVMAGVSDIIILEPRIVGGVQYHGFCLELKTKEDKQLGIAAGKTSDAQTMFLDKAAKRGYHTCVAFGFDEAQTAIDWYLNN